MEWLKYLLLPPLANVLLVLSGLLFWPTRSLFGVMLILLGLVSLLALAMPQVSYALRQGVEHYAPPTTNELQGAEAIVILGGGRDYAAVEFGWGDAPSNTTWRRLAYAAKLHRDTGLPILVSGGRVHGEDASEASLMEAALREVFGVEVRWLEGLSRNTAQNARFSADMLAAHEVTRVVLVSQAWHLARAVAEFERAGLDVIPAPTEFASPPPEGLYAWIPRAYYLRQSSQALHEWLGLGYGLVRERLIRRD